MNMRMSFVFLREKKKVYSLYQEEVEQGKQPKHAGHGNNTTKIKYILLCAIMRLTMAAFFFSCCLAGPTQRQGQSYLQPTCEQTARETCP